MPGTAHQEIELKRLLVGPGAADRLLAALGPVQGEEKHQINHVFDTNDRRLQQHRYAVRLRLENGTPFLTVKGPSRSVGADTGTRAEAEAKIDRQVAGEVLAGRTDPVTALRGLAPDPAYAELWRGVEQARAGQPLHEIGHFENLRRTVAVRLPSGLALEVEVDRTRFSDGRIDEEVEIEVVGEDVVPEVEAWLAQVAAAAGVTTAPSTPKVARFYASLPAD